MDHPMFILCYKLWDERIFEKNLIIEQRLYEYQKAPKRRFPFWQILSNLIFVHHWIVKWGGDIQVKPDITRGTLQTQFIIDYPDV